MKKNLNKQKDKFNKKLNNIFFVIPGTPTFLKQHIVQIVVLAIKLRPLEGFFKVINQ